MSARRAAAVVVAALGAGCSPSTEPADVCMGRSGCLAVHVAGAGSVTSIDQLELTLSGALTLDGRTPAQPGPAVNLPVAVAVMYPAARTGSVTVHAVGWLGGREVGEATSSVTLGAAPSVSLTLGPPADGGAPDLAMPDAALPVVTVTAVMPPTGPTSGGVDLVVTGTGFQPGAGLTVDGIAATGVTITSPTELHARLPPDPGALGKVAVKVGNPDGSSGSAPVFAYFAAAASLAPPRTLTVPPLVSARAIAVAELTGDAHADIVVAGGAPQQGMPNVVVLPGDGKGNFSVGQVQLAGVGPRAMAALDLNGDGTADVATANQTSADVSVMIDQQGMLQPAVNVAVAGSPYDLAALDFDGDGRPDLATVHNGPNVVMLLHNTGQALMPSTMFPNGGGGNPQAIKAADWNGDKRPDLAVANAGNNTVSIFTNQGGGNFSAAVPFPAGSAPHDLVAADFNRDGAPDLAVLGNANVAILLGRGDGSFQAPVVENSVTNVLAFALLDADGDGAPDLAVGDAKNNVALLRGSGDGTFTLAGVYQTAAPPHAMICRDVTADGRPDVVVANNVNSVTVLLNASQ